MGTGFPPSRSPLPTPPKQPLRLRRLDRGGGGGGGRKSEGEESNHTPPGVGARAARVPSPDHALVALPARLDHHRAAVFQVPQRVTPRLALIVGDQHAVAAAL